MLYVEAVVRVILQVSIRRDIIPEVFVTRLQIPALWFHRGALGGLKLLIGPGMDVCTIF